MKLTIKNTEVELKYTMRSLMIYERIANETFNPKGVTQILIYLYSTVLASAKNLEVTFDEFLEYVDDNQNILAEFNEWLVGVMNKNSYLSRNSDKDDTTDTDKKKD